MPTPSKPVLNANNLVARAEVMAVDALDELAGKLVKAHKGLPHDFLDWVGTEATEVARHTVIESLAQPEFKRVVQSPKAEVAIMRLVYERVMPVVMRRLGEMSLPNFGNSLQDYSTVDIVLN